ncbi:MAG: 2TM domain-containing protein [Cyanothece sp. SIO2G6]|nr:2TM domain-containing protein [Cyanothece sp. SIO2G6]
MSQSDSPITYRQEEIHAILQLAIAHQAQTDVLSRDQLFEIAEEMGLTPEEIIEAEQEWQRRKPIAQEKKAFIEWRQLQFQQHRTKYFIVNGFLMVFDWLTFGDAESGLLVFGSHALSFSIYIALVWGLFLTLDGWQSRQTNGKAFDKKFRSWQRRKWLSQSVRNFFGGLFKAASP